MRKPGHPVRVYERAIDRRDDIIDHDRLAAAASGCDAVIHLAAKVGLGVNGLTPLNIGTPWVMTVGEMAQS